MKLWNYFFQYYANGNSVKGVKNFSIEHFGWLCAALLTLFAAVLAYRSLDQKKRRKTIRICAASLVLLYMERTVWAVAIGHFSVDSMLPFHLCGAMVFLEFIAVFWDVKPVKELAYCAGLPGATVALVTPELNGYPLFSFQYQAFILSHMLLMLIPLMWIFGDAYEPDSEQMRKSFGMLCILAVFDGFVNMKLNSNYMFVSKAPANTPFVIIEKSFGYPGYIVFLVVAAFAAMNIMYLPWVIRRKQSALRISKGEGKKIG